MEKQAKQKCLLQIIMTVPVREITCNELLYGTHTRSHTNTERDARWCAMSGIQFSCDAPINESNWLFNDCGGYWRTIFCLLLVNATLSVQCIEKLIVTMAQSSIRRFFVRFEYFLNRSRC